MSNIARGNIAEIFGIVGVVSPVSQGAGTVTTNIIDASLFDELLFVLVTGVLGASATVDFALATSSASNMSGSVALSGKSLTQIVKASGDNKQASVRVTQDSIAANGANHRYIQGTITVGTAASLLGMVVFGSPMTYEPVSAYDLSTVVQIVM